MRPRGHGGQLQLPVPEYLPWSAFYPWFGDHWNQDPEYGSEHVAIVGQSGSGKTSLALPLLDFRDYVVVFGTKREDRGLYGPLQKRGYTISDKFNPTDLKHPKVIFRPPLEEPTPEALGRQREAFLRALLGVFSTRGWTIYLDEVRYLSETLKLKTELDLLWLQGRSLFVTIVAATQRPVSVPRNMFEQSTHNFDFRISGAEDRKTASEYLGGHAAVVYDTLAKMPHHEFLYVDKDHDILARSRVER